MRGSGAWRVTPDGSGRARQFHRFDSNEFVLPSVSRSGASGDLGQAVPAFQPTPREHRNIGIKPLHPLAFHRSSDAERNCSERKGESAVLLQACGIVSPELQNRAPVHTEQFP
jgi:hypothetical protein